MRLTMEQLRRSTKKLTEALLNGESVVLMLGRIPLAHIVPCAHEPPKPNITPEMLAQMQRILDAQKPPPPIPVSTGAHVPAPTTPATTLPPIPKRGRARPPMRQDGAPPVPPPVAASPASVYVPTPDSERKSMNELFGGGYPGMPKKAGQ